MKLHIYGLIIIGISCSAYVQSMHDSMNEQQKKQVSYEDLKKQLEDTIVSRRSGSDRIVPESESDYVLLESVFNNEHMDLVVRVFDNWAFNQDQLDNVLICATERKRPEIAALALQRGADSKSISDYHKE